MVVERDKFGFDAPAPLEHPARSGIPEGHSVGLDIGEAMPNIRLPDASGKTIDLHHHRNNAPAVVVFYRSAVW